MAVQINRRVFLGAAGAALTFGKAGRARAGTYDKGASDTEIKIGQFGPLSGPVAAWGIVATAQAAYYRMVNENGGVNGRKIKFIHYDDAYSPPKSVEAARKLVEGDEVLLISGAMGTPGNIAVQKYMNTQKVPQLFLLAAAGKLADPANSPWTMVAGTVYEQEGSVAGRYVANEMPSAKIGIIYQNDDAGKALLAGFKAGLDDRKSQIISETTYLTSDPTVDSQIVQMKTAGADFLYLITIPKTAVQILTKLGAMNWRPQLFFTAGNAGVRATIKAAGYENAQGALALSTRQDLGNPTWANQADMKDYLAFLDKYAPSADRGDDIFAAGYSVAAATTHVIGQCGDVLTRDNVLRQVTNLKNYAAPLLIPGVTMNTSATDYVPIKQYQLLRFKGEAYERIGGILTP